MAESQSFDCGAGGNCLRERFFTTILQFNLFQPYALAILRRPAALPPVEGELQYGFAASLRPGAPY